MDQIFADAGLVDASGAPTTEANWGKAPETPSDDIDWGKLGLESDEKPAEPAQPAAQTQPSGDQGANPAPFEPQPRQVSQYTPEQARTFGVQRIDQQMQEAMVVALSQVDAEGKPLYSAQQLQAQFTPMREALVAQLEAEVTKHQLAPYAREMVAQDIAKRHGVDAAEIKGEPTVEAMEAAAKTLARVQRTQKFDARAQRGTDRVEGGRGMSSAVSEAYEKLSPEAKIKYGLMRGDR